MKIRFSTLDILAILPELKSKICTGWRVNQVYDCDQKTFLFKLNKSIVQMKKDDDPLNVNEETANKMTLLVESGMRLHTSDFDWPRSHAPGNFSTKLRKHIRNKRVEDIKQVGIDRLIDIQFGSNMAANHLLIELYDKGNLILTDHEYIILAMLRWRKPDKQQQHCAVQLDLDSSDSENFKVGQKYPLSRSRNHEDIGTLDEAKIVELMSNSTVEMGRPNYKKRNKTKQERGDGLFDINLKDLLNPHVIYGSSLLEDKLLKYLNVESDKEYKKCVIQVHIDNFKRLDKTEVAKFAKIVKAALDEADAELVKVKQLSRSNGYIVQKTQSSDDALKSKRKGASFNKDEEPKTITTNVDFFPIRSCAERKVSQEQGLVLVEYESFDKAVDVYYCNMESQKLDSKAFVAEKEARKKLENLKIAHERRLEDLSKAQRDDEEKARLIELNCDKVEDALLIIRSMLANQIPWSEIRQTIKEAQSMKDPIASLITNVKFDRNEFTMRLCDPYEVDADPQNEDQVKTGKKSGKNIKNLYRDIEIDISLSAYANARRFFVKRRTAVNKEKKTIEVSKKAFKNVERRTKEMLKEVVVTTSITKARKRYWFENFFWFISSDGYLVVAGRDAEQNELLVKRYMKTNDIYVHADLHGASTVIIKNEGLDSVPPKTLVEAGNMAVCYSSAWDTKIATTSWWVYPKQVSKTAPAGEYLTVGSFIIRGKKNFLPLSNLVLGFGFLFRLEEESIEKKREAREARELNMKQIATADMTKEAPEEYISDTNQSEDSSGSEIDDKYTDDSSSGTESKKNPIIEQLDSHEKQVNTIEGETMLDELTEDVEDEIDDENKITEHRLIDTLTETPLQDDILLYAIPMCGPYSAFQNFKYKVKVVPGANKRGKAAKACLGMFLHDKRASQREKDLLRALKDQDYARNIPNKVKVSAANLKTMIKKRPKKSEVRLPLH